MDIFRRKHGRRPFMQTTLAHELRSQAKVSARRARRQAIMLAPFLVGVMLLHHYQDARHLFGRELDVPIQIGTVLVLAILGWAFARDLGQALNPDLVKRVDAHTAGTIGFLLRLVTMVIIVFIALRVVGVNMQTLLVGGAFTAVIVGLAAQQTLGNVIAGIVILSARPFKVGDRIRLQGAGINTEGHVSALGLLYTTLAVDLDSVLIPNNTLLTVSVAPIREPDAVDLRARLLASVRPSDLQRILSEHITTDLRAAPEINLEEVDQDGVVMRITATPTNQSDGPILSDQILSAISPYTCLSTE